MTSSPQSERFFFKHFRTPDENLSEGSGHFLSPHCSTTGYCEALWRHLVLRSKTLLLLSGHKHRESPSGHPGGLLMKTGAGRCPDLTAVRVQSDVEPVQEDPSAGPRQPELRAGTVIRHKHFLFVHLTSQSVTSA